MSSHNPHYPLFNSIGDARAYLHTLRTTVTHSWTGIEHVMKYLSEALQEKTNYAESLRSNLTAFERSLSDSILRTQVLEQTITHLQRQLYDKDSIIQEIESKLQAALLQNRQMQDLHGIGIEQFKKLSVENQELKAKLAQSEVQSQAVVQRPKLTEEQEKILRDAINKELDQRSEFVNKRVREIVMRIQEVSQKRITNLEEQLKRNICVPDDNIGPSLSDSGPLVNADGEMGNSALHGAMISALGASPHNSYSTSNFPIETDNARCGTSSNNHHTSSSSLQQQS